MSYARKLLVVPAKVMTHSEVRLISRMIKENGFGVQVEDEGDLTVRLEDEKYCSIYAIPHLMGISPHIEDVYVISGTTAYGLEMDAALIPKDINGQDGYDDPLNIGGVTGYTDMRLDIKEYRLPYYGDEQVVECSDTMYKIYKRNSYSESLYDTPWDNGPVEHYFINEYARDCYVGEVYSHDSGYEECEVCGRTIQTKNSSNGWMLQFRSAVDELGHMTNMCLRCYQDHILKHGEYISLKHSVLPGMFLELGEDDMISNGWEKDDRYVFANHNNVDSVHDYLVSLNNSGYMVIVGLTMLGICGMDGYFDIWKKKKETQGKISHE